MIPPLSFAQDDMRLLRKSILEDRTMDQVYDMAHDVVSAGLNVGSGYGEVWIRDFNTFITTAMDVMPDEIIRSSLNTFFKFQGPSGDIVDGYLPVREADLDSKDGYAYRLSPLAPQYAAHKNTVETDQETSLIQAVFQYVSKSGNSWIYSPVVAWDQSQAGKYKFVAYYTGTEKNVNASFNYTDKSISISNVTSDQDNQTDVLLAVSDEVLTTNVPISFGFRHALSMIKFTLTSKIGDVQIIDFTVSGLKSTGTVTMTDTDEISWDNQSGEAKFTLDKFTATTGGASSNEFVVVPQSNVLLRVSFKARIDGIEKTLTAEMPNQVYGNSYRYNYTAEITGADMDVIQFNAPVVSDWENYTDITTDVNKTN